MGPYIVLAFFIASLCLFIFFKNFCEHSVKSDIDGNYYNVSGDRSIEAANILAVVNNKILNIIIFLGLKLEQPGSKNVNLLQYSDHIRRLKNNYSYKVISENVDTNYTSYSMGKRYISFCLKQRDIKNNFVDINVLMYVALHELAHFGSVGIVEEHQHETDKEFKGFFKLLLDSAIECGEYRPLQKVEPYCGLTIT